MNNVVTSLSCNLMLRSHEIWNSSPIYTKNQLMFWSSDKKYNYQKRIQLKLYK